VLSRGDILVVKPVSRRISKYSEMKLENLRSAGDALKKMNLA
jgi:hypothetical protein